MSETYTSAELTLCNADGVKTFVNIEPGKLKAVIRVLGIEPDAEDPLFSKETYEMDPYFDRKMQARLRQSRDQMRSGNFVDRELTDD
jgi:hypothetical protein